VEIGGDAFGSCQSLESIKMHTFNPPNLMSFGVFQDTNECPIYVPSIALENYLMDYRWIDYSDRIVPYDVDVQMGDVNADGYVNISDLVMLINYILGEAPTFFYHTLADLDHSGEVNIVDAINLINEILNQ
jgi:hypothetical protein